MCVTRERLEGVQRPNLLDAFRFTRNTRTPTRARVCVCTRLIVVKRIRTRLAHFSFESTRKTLRVKRVRTTLFFERACPITITRVRLWINMKRHLCNETRFRRKKTEIACGLTLKTASLPPYTLRTVSVVLFLLLLNEWRATRNPIAFLFLFLQRPDVLTRIATRVPKWRRWFMTVYRWIKEKRPSQCISKIWPRWNTCPKTPFSTNWNIAISTVWVIRLLAMYCCTSIRTATKWSTRKK